MCVSAGRKKGRWGLGICLQWPEGEPSKLPEREKQSDIERERERESPRGGEGRRKKVEENE